MLTLDREEWAYELFTVAGRDYANESELRHGISEVLVPYCETVVGLEPSQIRHERTTQSGRFDTMLGTTLIEWKNPGELETKTKRRKHAEQALRYLEDKQIGAVVVILTDGREWGILRDPQAVEEGQTALELDLEIFPVSADEQFQWRRNSTETAGRVLDLLDTITFDDVNPDTLMNKLGLSSSNGREVISSLLTELTHRESGGRTDILFRQWLALAGVSYGIGDDAEPWPTSRDVMLGDLAGILPKAGYAVTIFGIHTYVALCSKFIAGEALGLTRGIPDQRPSQWPTLRTSDFVAALTRLENGQMASAMGAPRIMGGDLFGWYADVAQESKNLQIALRGLLGDFAQLGWARLTHATRISSDLLRDFYIRTVPRALRKGLGEFFTPEWIAERVVDKAIQLCDKEQSDLRFLDPSCGSGTFLVAAMRRVIRASYAAELPDEQIALRAVSSVTGFDINPVSSLMARVNLLLTLGELADYLPEIQFNVFQADSILIPEELDWQQVSLDEADSALAIPLVIGTVSLPASLARLDSISVLARVVDDSVQRERDLATFRARLGAELPSLGITGHDAEIALDSACRLYERLYTLHIEGRDGVWAHVIEQSFAPKVLEPVDVVVGNPPWISWKNLPSGWRERSESTWRRWGLWQKKGKTGGTPMGDISTLLLARSIATYSPNGIVALLLPEGALINDPGNRALRRASLESIDAHVDMYAEATIDFAPLFVDDFSSLNPFPDAATKPVALYVQSGKKAQFPFPGIEWERARSRVSLATTMRLKEAREVLKTTRHEYAPIDPRDQQSAWRPAIKEGIEKAFGRVDGPSYTWGQGFHTRGADGIFFCEIISQDPYQGNLVRIRTRPDLGRNTKGLDPVETLVEAKYLWPLVRGQDVKPFVTEDSGLYCIVPHDPDNLTKVIPRKQLVGKAPRLYDYLESHQDFLLNRSAYDLRIDEEYPWGIQGTAFRHLSRSRILVVSQYMHPQKTPNASVISPTFDPKLGYATTKYPNNKVNFVACSSLAEADYVAAFLNSDHAQGSIAWSVSSTTISPRTLNSMKLPKFDIKNKLHIKLADIGHECRISKKAWPALRGSLNPLVAELLASE